MNASSFSQSCVPVSVEHVDKDKDADENVDADQTRTGRPVSGQPIGLFTQLEEIDIDFRVSGLPHAVVKQAENFRVRDNSKAMIREMGNVELFELCETIPKVQFSQCLLYWKQGVIYCTCGHLLVESESIQKCNQLRLAHWVSRRSDTMVLGTVKLKQRNSTISPSMRGRDVAKELTAKINITKEFAIVSYETQFIVIRNSKLAGPSRSASKWIKLAQEDHSYRQFREEFQRYQKHWYLT